MTARLGLGTAQFGFAYGIANLEGRVPEAEVGQILEIARAAGMVVLDTAPAYGEAEAVLGQWLRPGDPFRITTKTPAIAASKVGEEDIAAVQAAFDASLKTLHVEHIAAVLVHQADDLLKPGGERLWALLRTWQEAGKVEKIGASVYERRQIDGLMARYPVELLQLPVNVFDQRLMRDGTLAALAAQGIEIHARSVFLQGLLLMEDAFLPAFATPWRETIRAFRAAADQAGASPLRAALSFVCQQPEIATVLIGVFSAKQLQECLAAVDAPLTLDWARYAIDDPNFVDPRRWPPR